MLADMSPELIAAIKERLAHGYSESAIISELEAAGYNEEIIQSALVVAHQESTTHHPEAIHTSIPLAHPLPSAGSLFKDALTSAFSRFDVVIALVVPLMTMSVIEFLQLQQVVLFSIPEVSELVYSLGLLFVGALFVVAAGAAVYVVVHSDTKQPSLSEGFAYGYTHFFSLLFLYILYVLMVFGGTVFLLIPALFFMVVFCLSQIIYVHENRRGMNALLRSQSLVKGNFWGVAGRLLVLYGGLFFFLFVAAFILALLFSVDTESAYFNFILTLCSDGAVAIGTVMSYVITKKLYTTLSAHEVKETIPDTYAPRWYHYLCLGVGILLIGLTVIGAMTDTEMPANEFLPLDETVVEDTSPELLKERATELRLRE